MSFYSLVKKMSEQIDVCHEFMKEVAPFVGSFQEEDLLFSIIMLTMMSF